MLFALNSGLNDLRQDVVEVLSMLGFGMEQDGKVKAYGEAGFTGPALLMVNNCTVLGVRLYPSGSI